MARSPRLSYGPVSARVWFIWEFLSLTHQSSTSMCEQTAANGGNKEIKLRVKVLNLSVPLEAQPVLKVTVLGRGHVYQWHRRKTPCWSFHHPEEGRANVWEDPGKRRSVLWMVSDSQQLKPPGCVSADWAWRAVWAETKPTHTTGCQTAQKQSDRRRIQFLLRTFLHPKKPLTVVPTLSVSDLCHQSKKEKAPLT